MKLRGLAVFAVLSSPLVACSGLPVSSQFPTSSQLAAPSFTARANRGTAQVNFTNKSTKPVLFQVYKPFGAGWEKVGEVCAAPGKFWNSSPVSYVHLLDTPTIKFVAEFKDPFFSDCFSTKATRQLVLSFAFKKDQGTAVWNVETKSSDVRGDALCAELYKQITCDPR